MVFSQYQKIDLLPDLLVISFLVNWIQNGALLEKKDCKKPYVLMSEFKYLIDCQDVLDIKIFH